MTDEERAELQEMVGKVAEGIENRLADTLKEAIGSISEAVGENKTAVTKIENKAKLAFETLPTLIQEQVETRMKANVTSIIEELGKQYKGKVAELGGNNEGAIAGFGLRELLAHSEQIIAVIQAWKQPTTEQAMLAQMNFVMKWHALLSKVEKGGGTPDEITQRITETFATPAKE